MQIVRRSDCALVLCGHRPRAFGRNVENAGRTREPRQKVGLLVRETFIAFRIHNEVS